MRFLILSLLLISFSNSVIAAENSSTENFLREFHQNPQKMYDKLPSVIDENGNEIDQGFINYQPLDRELLEAKEQRRRDVIRHSEYFIAPLSRPTEDDNVTAIVDNGVVVTNILELDRRGLSSHNLPFTLWSDSYWPYAMGLLSNRYADGNNPHARTDWSSNYAYFMANPTGSMPTNLLSPAEKYDLLVGDTNMSLTNYGWNRGRSYNEQYKGMVPSWMGICHGWSGAAHMHAKIPYGSITLKSPNGTSIKFYQSDVKALTSLLWANTTLPTRFLGNRCNTKPPRDGQGRTMDDKCRDNNAATVFLTLTNQLGINNRSFVVDATYDAEVWNYSVISYHSTYYNPQSFQQTDNIRQAIVPVSNFTIDKFKAYRAPGTAYVVGVTLDMTHLNEVGPSQGVQVKPGTLTKRYVMDLELDKDYNIIGGEWYSRVHPDFIWTYSAGSQAVAPGDADINANDWKVSEPVPPEWTKAAQKSSPQGQPLYSVLKKIVEAAPSTPPTNSTEEIDPTP